MNSVAFATLKQLNNRIDAYFNLSGGAPQNKRKSKSKTETAEISEEAVNEPQPATMSGLALFLGFHSLAGFEDHAQNGEFATALQRARLRMLAIYERRLLQQSPTGVMFALKSFGWDDRAGNKTGREIVPKTLTIEIVETGFIPAGDEKEVAL
ncbi:terminase small subunit [Mucilaginibacter sp.]|uniref:terminase small subunit n=1 Tax=Mucilaginibacter sp. TaxID=1882438 RepID=UPI00283D7FEF|nr:terminase small subunit [Mucilaginibacter sp.]MDR3693388.1 terminase small subunit [Mucilaginibacter sp.]